VTTDRAITTCPSCGNPLTEAARFCPSCGTSLDVSDSPTGTAPRVRAGSPATRSRRTPTPSSGSGLAASASGERFAPGTILLGRYRVLGLVGRGGMGEVYRADDLKLEQPVALKFLPSGLEADHDRLERFFAEVRVARQVSHPAVCRVWDVGETEGQHFLSMEYVDGENLSSLLRRIGRLPVDKALDIARQVCAGLGAAHEKGVLHRDLKPANIMLDGQGNVRITDFGLAGLAESFGEEDVRSGTPSFMSPEQLLGREVTVRSDVYSLGLLFYELFTGRRAFEGRTVAELTRKHRDEQPIEPSAVVPDLPPAVERTILSCLEKEPRRRPPSAAAVSAMLSGRDPLEAAIAAGDTPSPELVAAAGEAEGLSARTAGACLGVVVVAALAVVPVLSDSELINMVPASRPPAVLEDRAHGLFDRLGHDQAKDSSTGLWFDHEYFRHLRDSSKQPARWDALRSGRPAVLQFWYRQSPRPLVSLKSHGAVDWGMPPADVSGMAGAAYDLEGRLLAFYRVTPQVEEKTGPSPPADWSSLFAEAGLDPARLEPVLPQWTPPFYCDRREAWAGHWPERPDIPIRVELASYRGQPVWFEVVEPWTRPGRMQPWTPQRSMQVATYLATALFILLIGVGAVLARRNLVLGRGDRQGAFRLATALVAIGLTTWLLDAHHVADIGGEMGLFFRGAGMVVFLATLVWLFYLALEPYVRRLRPTTLVSWTRLLSGGFGDVAVGRDALIGATWGAAGGLALAAAVRLPLWVARPGLDPVVGNLDSLLGFRGSVTGALATIQGDVLLSLGSLLLYLVLRFVLRREGLALVALVGVLAGLQLAAEPDPLWLMVPVRLVLMGSYVFLLFRFGLLAAIVGMFVVDNLVGIPLTTNLGAWYAAPTLFAVSLVVVIGILSFRAARGGSGLRRYLSGDAVTHP
jgi:hypothetical protein